MFKPFGLWSVRDLEDQGTHQLKLDQGDVNNGKISQGLTGVCPKQPGICYPCGLGIAIMGFLDIYARNLFRSHYFVTPVCPLTDRHQ